MRLGIMGSFRIKGVVVVEFGFINFPTIKINQSKANHSLTTSSRLLPTGVSFFNHLETFAVAAQDSTTFLLAVTLSPRRFDTDSKAELPSVGVVVTVSIIVGVEFHSSSRRRHETLFIASSFVVISVGCNLKQSITVVVVVFKVNIEIRVVVDGKVLIYNNQLMFAALRPLLDLKNNEGNIKKRI